jgi:polyisoprenoid-binding protein YceI
VNHYAKLNLALLAALTLLLAGCGNPTADKTAATVTDAIEEPAPEPAVVPSEGGEPTEPAPAAKVYRFTQEGNGIDFEGYKVTGSHVGGFAKFEGTVTVPGDDITKAKVDLTIDMTSTYSDVPDLTKTLLGADFFEVETYPTSTFKSTSIKTTPAGGGLYDVTGNLALHGVTKGITFPAKITLDGDTLTTKAEFTIKRFDWDITYKGLADDLIREDVLLYFEIVAKPE